MNPNFDKPDYKEIQIEAGNKLEVKKGGEIVTNKTVAESNVPGHEGKKITIHHSEFPADSAAAREHKRWVREQLKKDIEDDTEQN